jgi:hypothetical protein
LLKTQFGENRCVPKMHFFLFLTRKSYRARTVRNIQLERFFLSKSIVQRIVQRFKEVFEEHTKIAKKIAS